MDFVCAGNWKMNKNAKEAADFVKVLRESASPKEQEQLILLPSALVAHSVAESLQGSSIRWGGQNCYPAEKGAFTGENSPHVLKSMGASFCLVGHSERRHIFAETDELISKKVEHLQSIDVTPILCVGETIDDRRWNRTEEVIVRQLRSGLQDADPEKSLWVAYEPVWAIGTGEVATPAQIEDAHKILRETLRQWSSSAVERTPILYGGSVKLENVPSLAVINNVNGFLIGGASLDPKEFSAILRGSLEARQ